MTEQPLRQHLDNWHQDWPVVIAGTLGIFTAVLYVYSTGLFIDPLRIAYGWNRTTVTAGMMLVGAVATFGNIIVGRLLDRVPPGRIALGGSIGQALGFASLALSGPGLAGWWAGWTVIAVSAVAISVPVWLVAVVRLFSRTRGLALAVGYSGSSIAAFSVPWLTERLIEVYGWRFAYVGVALIAMVTGSLASLILLRYRTLLTPVAAVSPAVQAKDTDPSVLSLLTGTVFWRMAVMSLIVTLGVIGLTVHFVSICTDHGIARNEAAGLAGLIGIAGVAGRLTTGYLLDRFRVTIIGALIFLFPATACVTLWLGHPGPLGMAFVAMAIGTSLGAELDIMAYVAGRYFPLTRYGLLFGILTGLVGGAAGFGPLFAGFLRDLTGSYGNFAALLSGGFLLVSLLVGTLGPYPSASVSGGSR
ncbi:MFS transporter [Novosphingobium sp. PASSN1]|uniref:MFS transporter n=1 Tax=Novosphingobium sp. PASSN1 TaxID=2015561 RepID=UPI0025D88F70|nr:MFS transporter [Novosphingobium sp. PASSN1]